MPYPRAHYLVFSLFVVTIVSFWPSFFASFGDAPFAFHAHGITASAWILLVAFQSWSIHNRRRQLHRTAGLASLILFPLLTASLVMIGNVSAAGYREGGPFYLQLAPVFGYATMVALLAYLALFMLALRNRRQVHLHAGYMLATMLLLWEPAASRLLINFIPSMAVNGPGDFYKVADAIAVTIAMEMLLAVYLYVRNRQNGGPFLVVAVFLALQGAGIYLFADTETWLLLFDAYAQLPATVTVGAGFLLGTLAAWSGWSQSPGPSKVALAK